MIEKKNTKNMKNNNFAFQKHKKIRSYNFKGRNKNKYQFERNFLLTIHPLIEVEISRALKPEGPHRIQPILTVLAS